MTWQRVCIIGVGLLGGSIGMRLRRDKLATEVVGFGRDSKKLQRAVELGAIDSGYLDLASAAQNADLVISCTPVQQIAESLLEASQFASSKATFTDVGSTKSTIVTTLQNSDLASRFVGSHPIAGSDKSGVEFATADLFNQKCVVVTPTASTNLAIVNLIETFWKNLGATTTRMSPSDHDNAIAVTSHLPHLLAAILSSGTPKELLELTGTGWCDTTRVAAGSPKLWRQILEENQEPVLHALQKFATISREWIEAMEAKDFDRVEQLLIAGKQIRDIVGNRYSSS
ncbi:MAG: prephenate dehydrogenase/arogenate dehydrogenase family protein [Pirellulaceae bacterium]|nr:prephenate dehydrogenase/arogenate dehydrogenase family protein [Pirellulaceae bacterium]